MFGLHSLRTVFLGLAVLCAAAPPAASSGASEQAEPEVQNLRQALERGVLNLDLRYRFEYVDDADFDKNAYASTLRGALSYETRSLHGFSAGVTFETVTAIGNDLLYDNAGAGSLNNGVTDRPVVADPQMVEVDRFWLAYEGPRGLGIRVGRFGFMLDNQRFVGIAAWRQNYRSFDGASIALGSSKTLRASYAYVGQVLYNNGAAPTIDGHLFHLFREIGPGAVSLYGYLLDWGAENRAILSSATYGARYVGESPLWPLDLLYFAEYGRQLDYGDNPNDFNLDYGHAGLGVRRGAWTVQAAWELKDGNGTSAVQTPLGTNHGKNGFADRLVVTPPDGSQDRYLTLAMDTKRWSWMIAYHNFVAARGGAGLGREVDIVARYTLTDPLSIFFKVARYRAETWLADTTKVMLWATWNFETTF